MHTTSFTLLQRVRTAADAEAWSRFVGLYAPLLRRWGKLKGLDDAEADDVTQEVFAILAKEMQSFIYDPARKFRSWLKTVATRKIYERNRRKRPVSGGVEADGAHEPAESPQEELWDAEDTNFIIRRAIKELRRSGMPERDIQVVIQTEMEGRPGSEVAAELGITANNLYVIKSRVLRRLRELIDEE